MPPAFPLFTPAQLAQRRLVWAALSDLFLDTDTRPSLPLIARTLAESDFDEAELSEIWAEELTPALHFNLTLVAGEWASFDLDWLEDRIVRRRAIRHRLGRWSLARLLPRTWSRETQLYFQVVLHLRAELLALPEPERPVRAEAWSWLARASFWPDCPHPHLPAARRATLAEAWTALEPALRPLLPSESAAVAKRAVGDLLARLPR